MALSTVQNQKKSSLPRGGFTSFKGKNFKSMVTNFYFKIYILQDLKDFGALSTVRDFPIKINIRE